MNDTQNIQLYVGENIKKIRLARGLSLEDVADKIYKSKSTISKYEKGTIAIDIATLEDISRVLDVHPAQLLMTAAPEKRSPLTQVSLDEIYMFSYDGREKRIIKSVIERYQTDESNRFTIHLYYDVPSKSQLGDCVSFYQGYSTKYDVLENYTLENTPASDRADLAQLYQRSLTEPHAGRISCRTSQRHASACSTQSRPQPSRNI